MFSSALQQISVGFQQVKLGERGGRRRDFNDAGINTRQAMAHVKDSKTGLSSLDVDSANCVIGGQDYNLLPEIVCVYFLRNERFPHSLDSKLLPHSVPPSVGSLSVPRGLQPANGVSTPEICAALPARRSARLSAEL